MKEILKKALFDTLPVMTGYLVLGAGFGILMSANGFSFVHSLLMSVFVYAGSLQYLGISLLTSGVSFVSIALSSFLVNARHLLYGISMFSKYKNTGKRKPYLVFALTDETYSLVCNKDDKDYYLAVSLLDHIYWISGTIIGSLVSSFVSFNTEGLDFVLTALFIVIFIEQWLTSKDSFSALSGLLFSTVCLLFFGKDRFLIPSMIMIVASLLLKNRIKESRNE